MLNPQILPKNNPRATMFIDMAEVFRALPESTQKRLDGAQFIHSGRWRYKVRSEDNGKDIFEILKWVDEFAPPVRHPAVIQHPVTKEKALYGTRGFTIGIADRTLDEPKELLREIFDFAEAERFIHRVYWSLGDVIIWDNRFLAHCSDRQVGPEEENYDVSDHAEGRLSAMRQPNCGRDRGQGCRKGRAMSSKLAWMQTHSGPATRPPFRIYSWRIS